MNEWMNECKRILILRPKQTFINDNNKTDCMGKSAHRCTWLFACKTCTLICFVNKNSLQRR